MKIVINRATAHAATATVGGIVEMFTGEQLPDPVAFGQLPTWRNKHHAFTLHHFERPLGPNAVAQDAEYIYEIDDVVLVKIMSVYVKIARLLVPVIKAVTALFEALAPTLDSDITEITDMLDAPAPTAKVAMH